MQTITNRKHVLEQVKGNTRDILKVPATSDLKIINLYICDDKHKKKQNPQYNSLRILSMKEMMAIDIAKGITPKDRMLYTRQNWKEYK